MRYIGLALILLMGLAPVAVGAAEELKADAAAKVAVEVDNSAVADVLGSLAKQSGEKIILESTVKGKVSGVSLKDVSLEAALTAVCNSVKCEWRKVYIEPDSKLIEQPDKMAATARLMLGLSFPDMMVAGASNKRVGVHYNNEAAVKSAVDSTAKQLSMPHVYLVTNDAALASKSKENEAGKGGRSEAVKKMDEMAKDMMQSFMEMSPEDREQAMISQLSLMDNVGPEYMSAVMETLMSTDPSNLRRMMSRQTEMLFSMSPDQRRRMLKMNFESMSQLTPEQQRILAEDAKALQEEMKNRQGQ